MELRRQSDAAMQRAVLYAAVLIFVHLIDLRPTQIETMEIKIGLPDPAILRGSLSIIFYAKFYEAMSNYYLANAWSRLHTDRWVARALILRSRAKGRSIRHVKLVAKAKNAAGLIFMAPYAVGIVLVVIAALWIGFFDALDLAAYAWKHGLSARVDNIMEL